MVMGSNIQSNSETADLINNSKASSRVIVSKQTIIMYFLGFKRHSSLQNTTKLKWLLLTYLCICVFTQTDPEGQQNELEGPADIDIIEQCPETTYTSSYTRCELKFKFCNSSSFTLQSCERKKCERYVRASDCRLEVRVPLQESECYNECCGSSTYSENECNQYNADRQSADQASQGVIIAIIIVSALIISVVIAYLLIAKLKCCEKEERARNLKKHNIVWKMEKVFESDSQCQICNGFGAALHTPCNHNFHLSCFEKSAEQNHLPICPKCSKAIQERIKISCPLCRERTFKIKLWKVEHLTEIMSEAKSLHDDLCSGVGKSSDHLLLSPTRI